ncbi:MAG: sarcosine oxidase subunit delta [Alphaproteobacteria bacterium]|nr:MAG: sarcosine oxidase subunit delta [Alphaproteobacteria bacterium]
MRIPCPYCGPRGNDEFIYLGDATVRRPDPQALGASDAFYEYVYLRDNPSGLHQELWYHGGGCRSWLVVTRNTRTHEISDVTFAAGGKL